MVPAMRVACPLCDCPESRYERTVAGFALERCGTCGHVFMSPQFAPDEIEELYKDRDANDLTAIYSRMAASDSVLREYHGKLDELERFLPRRGRLLDFACGAGTFFELAQRRGWDAHGTELGEWARHAADARGLTNLHIGMLKDLQFPTASFDAVYAAQVFEHLPRPCDELREIRRILKPGGLLYVDVPNYRTLSIVVGRDDFMLNEPPQHVNYFRARTLRAMLVAAGFDVTRVASSGGLKWENIVGKPIRSDRAKAYGLVPDERPAETRASTTSALDSVSSALKRLVIASIIKPVLYDRLKVGMVLFAYARR
jgi:SAM-dependent methyltransferase